MASRIVKVFDGPVPTVEQLMFNDPDRPPFPKEVWANQMEDNEIALFCENAKSGTPVREEDGRPGPRSEEYCRVSSDPNELRARAKRIVEKYPDVVCTLRAKDQRKIESIHARPGALRSATRLLGLVAFLITTTAVGFPVFILSYYVYEILIRGYNTRLLAGASASRWTAYLVASLMIGTSIILASVWVSVRSRVRRQHRKIQGDLTPEETTKYRSINPLSVSPDISDRRIASQLSKQFFERLRGLRAKEHP